MKALKAAWRAVRAAAAYVRREPLKVEAVLAAAYALARGVQAGHVTVDLILALVMAAAGLLARTQTTSLTDPRDRDGMQLVRGAGSSPKMRPRGEDPV